MSTPIISVQNLGKSYLVGHQSARSERYTALRDVVGTAAKDFARKALDMARGRQIIQGDEVEEFWALKDVSFEVQPGEVVGIIGRNGAGKSTLLKVLSRITEPSRGRITLRGRVASLLEVGTGFHPELTGRENIFLNGAVLGMTRAEIKRKFDEIVAFAGVEKFLDTPVKRYSSGMYVRLAFSVAAHLEPEILVIDEVLAVGDAEFQKKCVGKIKDVSLGGRTVLFVSHNMGAINQLCTRAILLKSGSLCLDTTTSEATSTYLQIAEPDRNAKIVLEPNLTAYFSDVTIADESGNARGEFGHDEPISIKLQYTINQVLVGQQISLRVSTLDGVFVFTTDRSQKIKSNPIVGTYESTVTIPKGFLTPGSYSITVAIHVPNQIIIQMLENVVHFSVLETGSAFSQHYGQKFGLIFCNCEWTELRR